MKLAGSPNPSRSERPAIYADVEGLATHMLFAEALANTGQRDRALFEMESATLCEGSAEDLAEAHARLAELDLAAGKRRDAMLHANKARALDPKNARRRKLPR